MKKCPMFDTIELVVVCNSSYCRYLADSRVLSRYRLQKEGTFAVARPLQDYLELAFKLCCGASNANRGLYPGGGRSEVSVLFVEGDLR